MKSFAELLTYGRELFSMITKVQAENEKRLVKMREQNIFNAEYLLQCQKEAAEELQKTVKLVSAKFAEVVKETVGGKRTGINKMLAVAPTPDQVNILTALQLQGKNVSQEEINSIAAQLTGNYQALHSLQAIAEQAGKRLWIPPQYDFLQLCDILKQIEAYLNDRVHALSTFTGDQRGWDFNSKCFFNVWEDTGNRPVPFYSENAAILDGNEQTTPAPKVEDRHLNDAEKAIVEGLFADSDIGAVMRTVMASPELRALVALHPEYGKLIK